MRTIELIEYSPGAYKWGGSRASGSNSKKPIQNKVYFLTFLLFFLYFIDRASRCSSFPTTNLTHFLYLYLSHLFTCFEHHSAHNQEIELY
jgi:hypothetical protein